MVRRGPSRRIDAALTYGPLDLDMTAKVVKVGDHRIDLTTMECRLLEYLMSHAESIVTRDELIQHVWGLRVQRRSNNPEVYVSYLRQKLAAMNPTDAIAPEGNHVDELRYLFLVSQVEVLDSPASLAGVKCSSESDSLGIGVVDAEGQKCDRCWNYSTHVGESSEDPTICDRCVEALAGAF
jgi:isoleucyl-tRNA synthetase